MRALATLRRLRHDEEGTTIVELAFVIALFLLIFFALLDFGRLTYNWNMAEKAVQMAARMAAVRAPVCPSVPDKNLAATGNTARFGTACSNASAICEGEVTASPAPCTGSSTNATATAIWAQVGPLLSGTDTRGTPSTADDIPVNQSNLRFTYTYDPAMNFLGGPYVPVVTVELQNLQFEFVSPLLGLARLAGASDTGPGDTYDPLSFPPMSVSLPGEDLALGDAG